MDGSGQKVLVDGWVGRYMYPFKYQFPTGWKCEPCDSYKKGFYIEMCKFRKFLRTYAQTSTPIFVKNDTYKNIYAYTHSCTGSTLHSRHVYLININGG